VLLIRFRFRSYGLWPFEYWRGARPGSRDSLSPTVTVNRYRLGVSYGLARDIGAMLTEDRERLIDPRYDLTNSAIQIPGGLPRDTQRLLKLADGDLPGECNKADCLEPQVQLEVSALENSADLHRERPAALVTLMRSVPGAFALQLADPCPRALAMWAYGAGRPKPLLAEVVRRLLVVEVGLRNP
jgi:hypothetical protein